MISLALLLFDAVRRDRLFFLFVHTFKVNIVYMDIDFYDMQTRHRLNRVLHIALNVGT